jgi:drug/metabolite transporter (DMT)-like permease
MENLHGAIFMVLSMAGFALEDMFVKLAADTIPTGQILATLGTAGGLLFAVIVLRQGDRLWSRELLNPAVILRNVSEFVGTFGYVMAVVLTPLSTVSAILQAMPLLVTMGAALFLNEKVGWRRWAAIWIGFIGVLLVIRPGMEGFNPYSLFAVLGVVGLSARDLATRRVPKTVTSIQLSCWAFLTLVPLGCFMLLVTNTAPVLPDTKAAGALFGAIVFGVLGYYAIVAAMRLGDVAVITPFRYTRLVFALTISIAVFAERPDFLTLMGAAIIVAAGVFTLWRNARHASPASKAGV